MRYLRRSPTLFDAELGPERRRERVRPSVTALRALTLWRPYCQAIVTGAKPVENRSWMPPEWLVGHEFAIHAGLQYDDRLEYPGGWKPPATDVGLVGLVRLLGAARRTGPRRVEKLLPIDAGEEERVSISARLDAIEDDPWATHGSAWWLLDEAVQVEAIPCRGRQGLWVVPSAEADELRARVAAARAPTAMDGEQMMPVVGDTTGEGDWP